MTTINVQNIRERTASDVVAPLMAAGAAPARACRSRTNSATSGTPTPRRTAPMTRHAVRQPAMRINASIAGGCAIAPTAPPAMTIARADPRRRSNHVDTVREKARGDDPITARPRAVYRKYNCAGDPVMVESNAMPSPFAIMHGSTTRSVSAPVEQAPQDRRRQGGSERETAIGGGCGLARPRELLRQRLQQHGECVRGHRREKHPDPRHRRHPPAFVSKAAFINSGQCRPESKPSSPARIIRYRRATEAG